MQVLPSTAADYGYTQEDLKKPDISMEAGVKHLARLNKVFGGDAGLVAAAYNAGEGRVQRLQKKYGPELRDIYPHLPKETRDYVARVVGDLSLPGQVPHTLASSFQSPKTSRLATYGRMGLSSARAAIPAIRAAASFVPRFPRFVAGAATGAGGLTTAGLGGSGSVLGGSTAPGDTGASDIRRMALLARGDQGNTRRLTRILPQKLSGIPQNFPQFAAKRRVPLNRGFRQTPTTSPIVAFMKMMIEQEKARLEGLADNYG
jgi:hypothetical protein